MFGFDNAAMAVSIATCSMVVSVATPWIDHLLALRRTRRDEYNAVMGPIREALRDEAADPMSVAGHLTELQMIDLWVGQQRRRRTHYEKVATRYANACEAFDTPMYKPAPEIARLKRAAAELLDFARLR